MKNDSYDDGRVRVDDDGVTLRRYYFPLANSRHIPFADIHAIESRPLGTLTGKLRLWGTGDPRYWLPWDATRPRRDRLVVLDVGRRVRPACTPDAPDVVVDLVRSRLGG